MDSWRKPYWSRKGRVKYLRPRLRLLLALVSAHLIIIYEDQHSFMEIYFQKYYYISLAISTLIAYGLISLVVRITNGLDFYYPWARSSNRRFLRQLCLGVFAPILPAIAFATIYFAAYGIPIWGTVYFSRYLQQIIILLAALNGYLFYLWFIHNKNKKILSASFNKTQHSAAEDKFWDIAYIFTVDKAYFSVSFDGEKLSWPHSISKSLKYLPPQQFCMLRQDIIVNRRAIADVVVSRKGQVTVTLVEPLEKVVLVSQRNQVYFKQWYQLPTG